MRTSTLLAPLAAVIVLAGCGGAPSPEGTTMPDTTPSVAPTSQTETSRPPFATTSPEMGPTGTPASDVPERYWSSMQQVLSAKGVEVADMTLVSAENVTWNNGALGCPEPGKMYTEALEDGMKVIVKAAGQEYDFRFGRSGQPVLCEQPRLR